MKCLACKEGKLKLFLRMKNVPPITQVVRGDLLHKDKKVSLDIYKCQRCTLLQIPKKFEPKSTYYEDYLIDRKHSCYFNKYQEKAAKDFITRFKLKNKNLLEVGCGDGYFAEQLKKEGAIVTGIDPSESACYSTRKKGIQVICGYINKTLKLNSKFHAFTLCQVLEHIRNPQEFLSIIRENMYSNGYGFIEVPSLTKTIGEKRFFDFFPDHVAYYNAASLSRVLKLSGFDVLDIHQSVQNEFLTAIVKVDKVKENTKLQNEFSVFQNHAKVFVNSLRQEKVIAWGAGIRGISVLSYSSITDKIVKYCIDSDKKKHGLFLPGSHLKVVGPEILKKEEFDVVIITASLYVDQIVKTLRKKLNYKNKIAVLFPEPKFI